MRSHSNESLWHHLCNCPTSMICLSVIGLICRYNCWIHMNTSHSEHSHSTLCPRQCNEQKRQQHDDIVHLQSQGPQMYNNFVQLVTIKIYSIYIAQSIKRCTHAVVCSITFASANQKVYNATISVCCPNRHTFMQAFWTNLISEEV